MKNILIARELVKIAKKLLLGIDFPTEQALKKYLDEHPGADKSLHKVVRNDKQDKKVQKKDTDFFDEEKKKKIDDLIQDGHERKPIFMSNNDEQLAYVIEHLKDFYIGDILENSNNIGKETLGVLKNKFPSKYKKVKQHFLIQHLKTTDSIEQLQKLSDRKNINILQAIANNSKTPVNVLQKLSNDEDFKTRKYVALNSNCSNEVLQKLSNDKDGDVRLAVIENPKTIKSKDLLQKFSGDGYWKVRRYVSNNPKCTIRMFDTIKEKNKKLQRDWSFRLWRFGAFDSQKREFDQFVDWHNAMVDKINNLGIDWSKMSPELAQRLKGMSIEQIQKFLGWLSRRKGIAPIPTEQ